jgi:hypothetical protein
MLIVGGLMVGFGTRLAKGCTSGHGVCGAGAVVARIACGDRVLHGRRVSDRIRCPQSHRLGAATLERGDLDSVGEVNLRFSSAIRQNMVEEGLS